MLDGSTDSRLMLRFEWNRGAVSVCPQRTAPRFARISAIRGKNYAFLAYQRLILGIP